MLCTCVIMERGEREAPCSEVGMLTCGNTTRSETRGTKDRRGCCHRGDYEWDGDSADGYACSGSGILRHPASGL